jgi:hypothetical protein
MRQISENHSYEELRGVMVDILVGREKTNYPPEQYTNLILAVGEVLARRGADAPVVPLASSSETRMHPGDGELVRDVFWDLFRQGFITLGKNVHNESWPWFRLSHDGQKRLDSQSPYRFHSGTTYLALVKQEVPDISDEAFVYLDEAVAAYYADCRLASCVMLGVAAEAEFLRLLSVGLANSTHGKHFTKADKERSIRQKIMKFQSGLAALPKPLIEEAGEDLDTHLTAIQAILRVARNDAGHPTATKPPTREQVYVYLQLFVPFAGQIRRLRLALAKES